VDINPVPPEVLSDHQSSDPVVGPVYRCVVEGRKPTKEEWKSFPKRSRVLMHQFSRLKVRSDGVLVRKISGREQLVLPDRYHQLVFQELHEKMGHLGAERVEELSRQRFYWPYMKKDIELYVTTKCACIADKTTPVFVKAPLSHIAASEPFELVSLDFMKLDLCKGRFQHVLVVTDHFTKFAQAYATKNKSSKAAADKLFNEFVMQFGLPKRIHHDRGGEFNSELMKELHRLAGVKMSNTTPYHPMGNGQCERFNRTLLNMLKSLPDAAKKNWKLFLPKLTFAYNSTINKTTGFSPFFLMFGRQSRLPLDCVLPLEPVSPLKNKTHEQFVQQWKKSMDEAFCVTNERITKAGAANKRRYDAKVKIVGIDIGDRVLLRNVEKGGTGKLRSCWEHKIYEVISKQDLVPVYTVRALGERKTKTVHRNMLMKVNELPVGTFGQQHRPVSTRPKKKAVSWKTSVAGDAVEKPVVPPETADSSSSESDGDIIVQIPQGNSLEEGGGVSVREEGEFDADSLDESVPDENDEIEDAGDGADVIYRAEDVPEVIGAEDEEEEDEQDEEIPGEQNEEGEIEEEEEVEEEEEIGREEFTEDGDIDEVSDPEDLETDAFSEDEADLTDADVTAAESDEPRSTEDYVTSGDESVGSSDVASDGDGGTTDTTYHTAVGADDKESNESDDSDSSTELERPQTVRRSARPRASRRVLTYDKLGGTPKITRYTLYFCENVPKVATS
jgi:transposase InsO family protein